MDQLTEIKNRITAFQAENKKKNEAFFKEATAFLFDTYPALESFSWNQYTPYFCDGDPCEFGVNTYDIQINEEEFSDWSAKERIAKARTPGLNEQTKAKIAELENQKRAAIASEDFKRAEKIKSEIQQLEYNVVETDEIEKLESLLLADTAIKETINAFDEDVMKLLFGDHVAVTVFRDRVETSGYDHE